MRNQPSDSQGKLEGLSIVVTRPADQADRQLQLIQTKGGNAHHLALIQIEPLQAPNPDLESYQLVIFISPNAVTHSQPILAQLTSMRNIPVAVIGKGTAWAFEQIFQRPADITPEKEFNSAGLLKTAALQDMQDKRVLIVRGEGGREELAQGLTERGASIDYLEVYRRVTPTDLENSIGNLLKESTFQTLIITSGEALQNLVTASSEQQRKTLMNFQLVVINERLAGLAKQLGFIHPAIISKQASDQALIDAIIENRAQLIAQQAD